MKMFYCRLAEEAAKAAAEQAAKEAAEAEAARYIELILYSFFSRLNFCFYS